MLEIDADVVALGAVSLCLLPFVLLLLKFRAIGSARSRHLEALRALRGQEEAHARANNDQPRKQRERTQERTGRALQSRDRAKRKDWWDVLGVSENATIEDATKAYRLKMKQYHPDRLVGLAAELVQIAEQRSRELNEALEQARRNTNLAAAVSSAGPGRSSLSKDTNGLHGQW
jgi:DnaJ-like protein